MMLAHPRFAVLIAYCAAATLLYPAPVTAQFAAGAEEASPYPQAEELARSLADTSTAYGTGAVALQATFLLQTIRAGAIGASEVKVAGPSTQRPEDYLRFEILTGLVFDSATTSPSDRLDKVWSAILAPSLERLDTVDIKPAGIEVVLAYDLRSCAGNHDGPAGEQTPLRTRFALVRIDASTLADFVAGAIGGADIMALSGTIEGSSPVWGKSDH